MFLKVEMTFFPITFSNGASYWTTFAVKNKEYGDNFADRQEWQEWLDKHFEHREFLTIRQSYQSLILNGTKESLVNHLGDSNLKVLGCVSDTEVDLKLMHANVV